MRPARLVPIFILGLVLALPAASEEIIHFTNGTTLAVRSHRVEDGMVHVDLGSNGFIAFPERVVERIEGADQNVKLTPSRAPGQDKVQRIAGGSRAGAPGSPAPEVQVLEAEVAPRGTHVTTDENGLTAYRPYENARGGKRTVGAVGNMKLLNQGTSRYRGTVPLGDRHVVGGTQDPRGNERRPTPIGVELGGGGDEGAHANKDSRTNPTRGGDDRSDDSRSDD